jgi:hypothetical protein
MRKKLKSATAAARAFFRTRTGRLVVHDLALAAAAAVAVVEGAHSVDAGVVKTAAIIALKVLLRLTLPVPPAEADAVMPRGIAGPGAGDRRGDPASALDPRRSADRARGRDPRVTRRWVPSTRRTPRSRKPAR